MLSHCVPQPHCMRTIDSGMENVFILRATDLTHITFVKVPIASVGSSWQAIIDNFPSKDPYLWGNRYLP